MSNPALLMKLTGGVVPPVLNSPLQAISGADWKGAVAAE